jgi:hypothetical protein
MGKKKKKQHADPDALRPVEVPHPAPPAAEPTYRTFWRFPAHVWPFLTVLALLLFGFATWYDQRENRSHNAADAAEQLIERVTSDPKVQRELADSLLRVSGTPEVVAVLDSIRRDEVKRAPHPVTHPATRREADSLYAALTRELPRTVPVPNDTTFVATEIKVQLAATPFQADEDTPSAADTAIAVRAPAPAGGVEEVAGEVSGGVFRDAEGNTWCGGSCRPELGQICCRVAIDGYIVRSSSPTTTPAVIAQEP